MQADELLPVHRYAAGNVIEVFAEYKLGNQLFQLREAPFAQQCIMPGTDVSQRLCICCKPCQTMDGVLFQFHCGRGNPSVNHHTLNHVCAGVSEQRIHFPDGRSHRFTQLRQDR